MKKVLSMLCVVLVVGFAGTAFAEKAEKVDVCHNGSVYNEEITELPASYNDEAWVPGSFVINISGNALNKHLLNHGDTTDFTTGESVITEVSVEEGIITDFEEQLSCVPN